MQLLASRHLLTGLSCPASDPSKTKRVDEVLLKAKYFSQ